MDTLTAMRYFAKVARVGSFSKVAEELHTSPSNVSKHVAFLENKLNARLLQRTTRVTTITMAGEQYLKHCEAILEQVGVAEREVLEQQGRVSGELRVSLPSLFGDAGVAALMAEFLEAYPDVDLAIYINDRFVDLIDEGFDLCVRASSVQPDSSLIYRAIGKTRVDLVGTVEYFERNGRPSQVSDLNNHTLIVHRNAGNSSVAFTKDGVVERAKIRKRVRVNSTPFVRDLVAEGLGLAFLPRLATHSNPGFCAVLDEFEPEYLTLSVVYPERQHTPLKVYRFIEVLTSWFERQQQTGQLN
ncbi:HTH-type transcriptional regulator DmlR [Grimontia celer]|uniref:HTH-type transcriptional regulator DmlR n=1 Tax=Grimontia celer TaxID=1796497 RepID=A0A128ET54_9GAMM|nr:LysR family transcriptional regulator [Grimontia celer]CZF77757.1 HTH-type transcriptional regulator DmlR [Grimontia celer]